MVSTRLKQVGELAALTFVAYPFLALAGLSGLLVGWVFTGKHLLDIRTKQWTSYAIWIVAGLVAGCVFYFNLKWLWIVASSSRGATWLTVILLTCFFVALEAVYGVFQKLRQGLKSYHFHSHQTEEFLKRHRGVFGRRWQGAGFGFGSIRIGNALVRAAQKPSIPAHVLAEFFHLPDVRRELPHVSSISVGSSVEFPWSAFATALEAEKRDPTPLPRIRRFAETLWRGWKVARRVKVERDQAVALYDTGLKAGDVVDSGKLSSPLISLTFDWDTEVWCLPRPGEVPWAFRNLLSLRVRWMRCEVTDTAFLDPEFVGSLKIFELRAPFAIPRDRVVDRAERMYLTAPPGTDKKNVAPGLGRSIELPPNMWCMFKSLQSLTLWGIDGGDVAAISRGLGGQLKQFSVVAPVWSEPPAELGLGFPVLSRLVITQDVTMVRVPESWAMLSSFPALDNLKLALCPLQVFPGRLLKRLSCFTCSRGNGESRLFGDSVLRGLEGDLVWRGERWRKGGGHVDLRGKGCWPLITGPEARSPHSLVSMALETVISSGGVLNESAVPQDVCDMMRWGTWVCECGRCSGQWNPRVRTELPRRMETWRKEDNRFDLAGICTEVLIASEHVEDWLKGDDLPEMVEVVEEDSSFTTSEE